MTEPRGFLFLPAIRGLDGAKVGVLGDEGKELGNVGAALAREGRRDANHEALAAWWDTAMPAASGDAAPVKSAVLEGGRMALKVTAAVPAIMAVLYLTLILYFKAKGGYAPVQMAASASSGRK